MEGLARPILKNILHALSVYRAAKLTRIQENLAETLNPEIIDEVLSKGETLRIYWGKCSAP